MSEARVLEVAELDFRLGSYDWPFARERAEDIAAYWAARKANTPALYDGRVLLLARHELNSRADGRLALRGVFFETNFSAMLAWREWGFPGGEVCNAFSMAALLSSDGAYLLGEMGPHTSTAGAIYFAAGTPDAKDVFGDRVDLAASARRELEEETGVAARETRHGEDWVVAYAPPRIACMKIMRLDLTAEAAKARIDAFLASEREPELARMHIARAPGDLDPARAPKFVRDFLDYAFAQRPTG